MVLDPLVRDISTRSLTKTMTWGIVHQGVLGHPALSPGQKCQYSALWKIIFIVNRLNFRFEYIVLEIHDRRRGTVWDILILKCFRDCNINTCLNYVWGNPFPWGKQ